MHILVIGGTRFVGRHIVECALARGHQLTLFHRGHTGKGLFDVEEIFGDRDGETDVLMGRQWDAVIDTCGYVPRVVEQTADVLAESVGLYCFISTISVYSDDQEGPMSEDSKLIRFDKVPESEEITGESYGAFKALCEDAVTSICGAAKTLIIRPGLVVGPHDPSDRFTYWVDRFSRTDPVLLPDRGDLPMQFIDARDLAAFTVRMVEEKATGVFNAVGPAERTTLADIWRACQDNCDGRPEIVTVSDEFLATKEVRDWVDLPLVLERGTDKHTADIKRALSRGISFRPMPETVRDTAEWHLRREVIELKAGLSRERERELIAEWRNQ